MVKCSCKGLEKHGTLEGLGTSYNIRRGDYVYLPAVPCADFWFLLQVAFDLRITVSCIVFCGYN
jgi:hypothetical protein